MSEELKASIQSSASTAETRFIVDVPDGLFMTGSNKRYIESKATDLIIKAIAERYVEENYIAISAVLNPVAVANLAIVDAAKDFLKK